MTGFHDLLRQKQSALFMMVGWRLIGWQHSVLISQEHSTFPVH